jgi:DNA-binding response OmpR family regulator
VKVTNAPERVGLAMSVVCVPELASAEPSAAPAKIRVVGLLGAGRIAALVSAGHDVALDPTVEFARLDGCDLLMVALAPPEPPPVAFLRVLRQRSSIPVLVLVPDLTATERRQLLEVGAARCSEAACSDAQLLADVDSMLARCRGTPGGALGRSTALASAH